MTGLFAIVISFALLRMLAIGRHDLEAVVNTQATKSKIGLARPRKDEPVAQFRPHSASMEVRAPSSAASDPGVELSGEEPSERIDSLLRTSDARDIVSSAEMLGDGDEALSQFIIGSIYLKCSSWRTSEYLIGGAPSSRCMGMPEDGVKEGLRWLHLAADGGNAEAWFALGQLAPTETERTAYLKRAAQLGHRRASSMLTTE